MAELTFKSAGVSTREIDLSQPSTSGPKGVPAGVIGTSNDGPAFVPVTVASYSEFASIFGETDGEKFGPLAVAAYLKNAQSLTYIRVLGVGDGKKRNTTTGVVTNAGFNVGDKLVQANGIAGTNPYSNSEFGGRTYFLGCFMQDATNSTIFTDAGIGSSVISGSQSFASIELIGHATGAIKIEDALGTIKAYHFTTGTTGDVGTDDKFGLGESAAIKVKTDTISNAATIAASFITAVEGAAGHNGTIIGTNVGSGLVTLTQRSRGKQGNTVINYSVTGIPHPENAPYVTTLPKKDASFASGSITSSGAAILRGVLMAPNGVTLCLSTGSLASASPVFHNTGDGANSDAVSERSGSVLLSNQNFAMSMRGLTGTSEVTTIITASFDVQSPNYFANVFNKDPLKIQDKGHLLYANYDIHSSMAIVTGSGVVIEGHKSSGATSVSTQEDIAFILTGSNDRGQTASLGNIPDYEDFQDRFSHAETSYLISQEGGSGTDLFKLVALSPGDKISEKIKFSIERLTPGSKDKNQYGSFDLIIRELTDTDDNKVPLETFRNINLDPTSDRYIGRAIGDFNTFFDFDSNPETQKVIVEGSHPNKSKFVRVVVGSKVSNKNIQVDELPIGFRGPKHLVTSGTMLSQITDVSVFHRSDVHQAIIELPIPYRENLSIGTGLNKKIDTKFYWGIQTSRKIDPSNPNKLASFDKSFLSFAKYFPSHRKDTTGFLVGSNNGTADINGSVLDSDRFNNNKFSLANIKLRTGSDGKADPLHWLSASYVRGGYTDQDHTNKYRAFSISDGDLDNVANRKYLKFTGFFQGGFDGSNIFNKDKQSFLNNAAKREIDDTTNQGGTSGPTVGAYRKAVDIMESKSDVDIQLLAIPGIRHSSVTDYAISAVENRFDALYIMDIEERDQLDEVVTSSADQIVSVTNTVKSFKNRGLDTSFAAAYFPDINVVDPTTRAIVQAPPSVGVLGAYSLNDKIGHPWFAPAGFTRGALSAVDNTSVYLNRENLDDLYEADINPIASLPGAGITIWGQKTLLQNQSALDRVNVRRLLIDIRRKVRNIANTLLFEPNRTETLEKFSALVNPVLQRVQSLSGVDRYKVVIDTSTTTQADVENNTIRGKIYLQPTRTVEFVALDFVVTNAGSNLL
jgi:hypothetical protein